MQTSHSTKIAREPPGTTSNKSVERAVGMSYKPALNVFLTCLLVFYNSVMQKHDSLVATRGNNNTINHHRELVIAGGGKRF